MAVTTHVALEGVSKAYGVRPLLEDVTLGITDGSRIGVVGRNGGGKTTLVQVLAGRQPPDAGRVVRLSALTVAVVGQRDDFSPGTTLASHVLGGRDEHQWAGDARIRAILTGLLGGLDAAAYPDGLLTPTATMSGGERRRVSLAAALVEDPDLLLLDEPTNHLDVEAITWLAGYLAARRGSLLVVTHDRWFLDAVCTETWEVAGGEVHRYDGGYAAYVLARAERERVAAVTEERRTNLLRKELAWLRRGPPARTSKPKFRIEAAQALIADEPPARDRLALQRFATTRLGKQVYDLEDVTVAPAPGAPEVLSGQTLHLGPGDRIGLLGANGAGKTTLLRLLAAGHDGVLDGAGCPEVRHGDVRVGKTVDAAYLSQSLLEMDPDERVLASVRRRREQVDVGRGRTLTAQQLLEGFGFTGDRLVSRVGELSGGERRRLQLLSLLVAGPNVLLLDEPTNDLDVETLTVLEDLLDTWPGTLVVVSHDRYFLERTTDTMYAMPGDRTLRYLTRGVDEYLELRTSRQHEASAPAKEPDLSAGLTGGELRTVRKELARLERRTDKLRAEEATLHAALAAAATDHERVLELAARLREVEAERTDLEEQWLHLAVTVESL